MIGIKSLYDKDNNVFYPQTSAKAVTGLSSVAKTGDFNDLNATPNLIIANGFEETVEDIPLNNADLLNGKTSDDILNDSKAYIEALGLQSKTDEGLITTDKTITGAINEVFTDVGNGKDLIAAAITDKGIQTAGTDTFAVMAGNIAGIQTGIDTADATATAADILSGKTAYVNDIKLTGAMANRGTVTSTITTQNGAYTVPEGYHNGSGSIKASFSNLYASNIKKGVNVGGVVGTYGGIQNATLTIPSRYFGSYPSSSRHVTVADSRGVVHTISLGSDSITTTEIKITLQSELFIVSYFLKSGTQSGDTVKNATGANVICRFYSDTHRSTTSDENVAATILFKATSNNITLNFGSWSAA